MAHLLLLKISNKKGQYAIARHITNNINDGTWPTYIDWIRRNPKKKTLKRDIIHFAVDMQDLFRVDHIMRERCANDPLNMTDWIAPKHSRRPRSEESKRKQSASMKQKPPFSDLHRYKIKQGILNSYQNGRSPHVSYYNAENTEKMNAKIRQNPYNIQRPKLKCPHCYKTVSVNMYGRWHGEKCKYNW